MIVRRTLVRRIIMDPCLESLKCELSAAIDDLAEEQMRRRRSSVADSWSIQQIVEHLLLTYKSTHGLLAARLAKGTSTRRRPTLGQRAAQRLVLSLGHLPGGRKAPDAVQPPVDSAARSGAGLAGDVCLALSSLDELMRRCEQVLGEQRAVTHFALGPMSMAQWKRFHLVHGRHHVKQIRAIRKEYGL